MGKEKILLVLIIILASVLRLYHVSTIPPALNWDEASLGFNAFSISETLKDEHGEFLPVTRFIAYGDYKPPGYIYITALSVKALGLNEFSVRLPSSLAGILLILVTYFLVKQLKFTGKIALGASFILAISPWAIQFSRGAFEANLATLLTALGVLFFLRRNIFFSALFFAGSMYTFNSHRIFTPLLIGVLFLVSFYQEKLTSLKKLIPFALLFLLFVLPLVPYMLSREGKLRFEEVTWLNDLDPIVISNERQLRENNSLTSRIFNNRRVVYGQEFLKHYFDHFKGDFLFYSGDVNPRLSIQTVGLMYVIEIPLFLFGLWMLVKKPSWGSVLLLAWLLLAPIPAAFARETPHALRVLNMIPVPQIIIALGLINLMKKIKWLVFLAPCFYLLSSYLYLHDYYLHYPQKYAMSWQFGYKQMVEYVKGIENKYAGITITESYGRPYIYTLFYNNYSPEKYIATRNVERDWFGFWYVHGFGNYHFGDTTGHGKWLYVKGPKGTPANAKHLKNIVSPTGEVIFEISETQ